jgi:photosystem II stability/assembly factor-like uncharacterized protein
MPSQSPPFPIPTISTQTALAANVLPVGELLIAGLQAIQLIGAPQSSDSFYALTPTGLYLTHDGGLTWAQVTPTPQQDSFVFGKSEVGTLYAGAGADCYRGGPDQPFYKSVNGGATWSELPGGVNLRPVAVHSADPNQIWAIGCAGPTRSSDGGETWTSISHDLFLLYDVTHVTPSPDWSEIYVAGASEGGSGFVAASWDAGQSWESLLQESAEHVLWWINDLLVLASEAGPSQLFLADPHNVWRSPDGGATWRASNAGLQDVVYRDGADFTSIGLNALAVDHDSTPPTVYLGTAQGVYQSLDGGETWTKLTGGPWENAPILDLDLRPARLLITSDQGVFVFEP